MRKLLVLLGAVFALLLPSSPVQKVDDNKHNIVTIAVGSVTMIEEDVQVEPSLMEVVMPGFTVQHSINTYEDALPEVDTIADMSIRPNNTVGLGDRQHSSAPAWVGAIGTSNTTGSFAVG